MGSACSHIAGYFDARSVFIDIIENPSLYLNGTMQPNVTGDIIDDCPNCTLSDKDSWLWYVVDWFHIPNAEQHGQVEQLAS